MQNQEPLYGLASISISNGVPYTSVLSATFRKYFRNETVVLPGLTHLRINTTYSFLPYPDASITPPTPDPLGRCQPASQRRTGIRTRTRNRNHNICSLPYMDMDMHHSSPYLSRNSIRSPLLNSGTMM
jgi:hypothetical protein